jgi:hypothetical protein
LSERSAGRRAVATATAGDCLQAEEQLTKQVLGSPAVKRTIDYRADAAKQSSKRPRIDNTPSNSNNSSSSSDSDSDDDGDNGDNESSSSDWAESAAVNRIAVRRSTKGKARDVPQPQKSDSDHEVEDPKVKINFRNCPCQIPTTVKNKLVLCRKRAKNDPKQKIKDIELVTAEVLAAMCWNHVREFCGGLGLKTKTGGREQLARKLEAVRENRFSLGNFMASAEHKGWFKQSHRGVSEEDALGSLKYWPAAPPQWDYDQDQVLLRFGGREVLKQWKKDGTTVVRGAMAWLFEDEELAELIKEEVLLYTHHRRRINGRPNL